MNDIKNEIITHHKKVKIRFVIYNHKTQNKKKNKWRIKKTNKKI